MTQIARILYGVLQWPSHLGCMVLSGCRKLILLGMNIGEETLLNHNLP